MINCLIIHSRDGHAPPTVADHVLSPLHELGLDHVRLLLVFRIPAQDPVRGLVLLEEVVAVEVVADEDAIVVGTDSDEDMDTDEELLAATQGKGTEDTGATASADAARREHVSGHVKWAQLGKNKGKGVKMGYVDVSV